MLSRQLIRVTSHDAQLTALCTLFYGQQMTKSFNSVDKRCRTATTTSTIRPFLNQLAPPSPQKKPNLGISLCFRIAPALFSARHDFCIRVKDVNPREKTAHCSRHRDSVSSRMLSYILHTVIRQTIRVASLTKSQIRVTARFLAARARILPDTARMCCNHSGVSWLSPESTFNEVEPFLS